MPHDRTRVLTEFDATARAYDRLTSVNPGYHRHLALSARRLGLPDGGRGLRLLDAGCGTGASTRALLEVAPAAEIVAFDASAEMLARARRKSWPSTVRFVQCSFDELDSAEGHCPVEGDFDGVLAAYLVRNLDDVDEALGTLRSRLRPGAPLVVHEYSLQNRWARTVWTIVCAAVIVPAATIATRRPELFRYLRRSVLDFDPPSTLRSRLRHAGFKQVRSESVRGWQHGIVHSFFGRRA
ncbi:methyltransferase domain-containing protein [Allosaccharopolyspora coralli]|uniref:Methyltransferase domain-containing protein n=1 Tax=Allosaccharopolyspora coralli TaxID=2665642 RepID=A0A5Q3QF53_9PSEU|nr:class I SAM-dependent methyltransferase [Allosaccharopolyspora coralli]QGK70079.1 methyltransferase domain-containing protein [Allosaccharopolyspora coralli]